MYNFKINISQRDNYKYLIKKNKMVDILKGRVFKTIITLCVHYNI